MQRERESLRLVWLSGNVIGRINEVTVHRAGLVQGWVTVCRYTIPVSNQPCTQVDSASYRQWDEKMSNGLSSVSYGVRQVWRIPFTDERGCAGKTVRSLDNACYT